MQTTTQALVLLAFGLAGASARAQVAASDAVAVRAPGVVVPVPMAYAAYPDIPEAARAKPVQHPPSRSVTDANPYGDAPSSAEPSEVRLHPGIDKSNPYAFKGSDPSFPERALPDVAVLRKLDFENPYGAGLAAVERAPSDSENPYVTGTR